MSPPAWLSVAGRLAAAAVPAAAVGYAAREAVRVQRVPRLPEAARGLDRVVPPGAAAMPAGAVEGQPGGDAWAGGAPVSLVAIGDSVVSGVGCTSPESSVPGVLARLVADALGRPVHVRCLGRTGARAEHVRAEQVPRLAGLGPVDLIVVSVGANDTAHLTPAGRFAALLRSLCEEVHAVTGAPVLLTGVPEFRSATAIGRPLRTIVWLAGQRIHERQRRVAAELPCAGFVDVLAEVSDEFRRDPGLMAEDGYHPSDRGAARLARAIAPAVVSRTAAGELVERRPA